jgi:hypothetical protein
MLIIGAPVTLWSLVTLGRLSYSGKGYLYGVVSDADIMENGFAATPLSPLQFIADDPGFVLGAIWTVTSLYSRSIFLEREWLAPLAVGWPAVVLALARRHYPWTAGLVLVAAAANFGFYALTWSSWQDRFMLTTVFLLLPFVVDGLLRTTQFVWTLTARRLGSSWLRQRGPIVLLTCYVGAVLALWAPRFADQYQGRFRYGERPVGTRVTDGMRWTGPPRWVNDGDLDEANRWIRRNTSADTILALGTPWPYTFFTGRPSVLLPYQLTDRDLRRFLVEYRVSYVLHDPSDPRRRRYAEQLRELAEDGVQSQRVKDLVVFDTRPLWHDPQ